MLACARLGAVHSVVFGGFAAHELAARIDDARPAAIVTASCGVEPSRIVEYKPMIDAALEVAEHAPPACVVVQRDQHRCEPCAGPRYGLERRSWPTPSPSTPCRSRPPTRCTSSTPRARPGKPKGIVRDNGGHAVALLWSMRNIYDIAPGDVFWAASDVGWVVGHSYIVYGPLLLGATTVLYEGKPVGTPDAGAFWRVASEHRVKALFTAPTALRAIQQGRSRTALISASYDLSGAEVPLPGRRAARPRHLPLGVGQGLASRLSTIGGRRKPDGPSRPIRWAWSRCPSSRGRPRSRCPDTTCASFAPDGSQCSPGRGRRDLRPIAAAAGHIADAVG